MEILDNWKLENDFSEYVVLDEGKITYCQDSDCTESSDEVQSITISTRNNGVAKFLNIQTENWSFDNTESLAEIIEDAKKRLCVNYDEQK